MTAKARNIIGVDYDDGSDDDQPAGNDTCNGDVSTVACRVNTKQLPFFKAFHRHRALRLTPDTRRDKYDHAQSLNAQIGKSSQLARQQNA